MLLILSLIALLLGILCLYAEMSPYEFKFRGFQGNLTAPAQWPAALTALDRWHVANGTAWKAADGLPSVVA